MVVNFEKAVQQLNKLKNSKNNLSKAKCFSEPPKKSATSFSTSSDNLEIKVNKTKTSSIITPVILINVGSFSPITNLHLRMFGKLIYLNATTKT